MMFSQESSQATFEMGNVELIEVKNSRIYTTNLKEQLYAHVANLSDPTRRWYNALEQL